MDTFNDLLKQGKNDYLQVGDVVNGQVISISKSEVKLDLDRFNIGVIRGRELWGAVVDFKNVHCGDMQKVVVLDIDNERGEIELGCNVDQYLQSSDSAGASNTNGSSRPASNEKVLVTVTGANRGGLLIKLNNLSGFLPASQLSQKHYPRVEASNKDKILEKLNDLVGKKIYVQVLNVQDDTLIVSEKNIEDIEYLEKVKQYQIGQIVEGEICAVAEFGVFIKFDGNMEGLIHISELTWQRVDRLEDIFKVGDKIKAAVLNIDEFKIFLSAKALLIDPWENINTKYNIGQSVQGKIVKINPFGLFVELDPEIQGLAHVSELANSNDIKVGDVLDFTIITMNPKEHRLGLSAVSKTKNEKKNEENKPEQPVEQLVEQSVEELKLNS